tara:strand:- start:1647 stop:2903 length:1257 start_codon:yes stop_codon:yes gene_type:complete
MNYKFLITLLSSSNEKLLKLVYNTIINQYKHNLDYTIIIVVNSLDTQYYQEVCNEFKSDDVEIVETESNGKPGKGHNSLFEIFRQKTNYDYLISIDGDDFLYPYALHQLEKCFEIKKKVDVVCIYGNDTLRDNISHYDSSDIYLHNNFYLRIGYNLPKTFADSESLINPLRTNIIKNGVQTIIRFIMCSRNFINSNQNTLLYCENCNILDDYRFYLNYIDNVLNKNIEGLIINSDHIYLYNNINHNSVSKIYNSKYDEDYKIITNYINEFKHLEKNIGTKWSLNKLDYVVLSKIFNDNIEIKINNDGSFNINKDELEKSKNYLYLIDFANDLCMKYYNICILNIEHNLFTSNGNKQNALDLCKFLINNKICDRKVYIYMAICYYYCNDTKNTLKYIEKSDYMIFKYPILLDFYKNNNK